MAYRPLRRLLPVSLFGRALLILVLPVVLLQAALAYVFFERHWDSVTRHMSNALAGEIAFLVQEFAGHSHRSAQYAISAH